MKKQEDLYEISINDGWYTLKASISRNGAKQGNESMILQLVDSGKIFVG